MAGASGAGSSTLGCGQPVAKYTGDGVLIYFGHLQVPSSRLLFLGEIYAKLGAIAEGLNCVSEAQPVVDIGERERDAELNRSRRISEWQGDRRLGIQWCRYPAEAKIVSTIAEWLSSLGLSEYARRLAENDIDESVLRS